MRLQFLKVLRNILFIPRKAAIKLIRFYQATLSPDHGPIKHLYPYGYCRHHPTCSEYGISIIEKKGLIVGGIFTICRLITCTPWKKPSEKKILHMLKK